MWWLWTDWWLPPRRHEIIMIDFKRHCIGACAFVFVRRSNSKISADAVLLSSLPAGSRLAS